MFCSLGHRLCSRLALDVGIVISNHVLKNSWWNISLNEREFSVYQCNTFTCFRVIWFQAHFPQPFARSTEYF